MTRLHLLLLSLLSLLAAQSAPVSASNDACAIDDETGLLQTGRDAVRLAALQRTERKKRHAVSKAGGALDQPEDQGDVGEEDDVQEKAPGASLPAAATASMEAGKKPEKPENDRGVKEEDDVRNDVLKAKEGVDGESLPISTTRPTGAGTIVTDSTKHDKVVEILIPGSKGASSTVLRILNPERIYAQKAVNESIGSIVKVENKDNMVLKATNVEDGQSTVYDEGEKRVAQASTKISITASAKGKIQNLDELLAKAKQALQEAQHDMQALNNATHATLAAKGQVRNATLAKELAEKRLDQLASNPGIVHSTVAGVEEAAQLAKQTLQLDGEAREDRKSARAADAERRAVASRMARQVALAAEYCACGYVEAAESTDGTHVNFTNLANLAEEFRQEPARVAKLRAKLAMAKAAKGEGDALSRTVVKVRTKDKIKLSNGEEAPAGTVVIIERPAAVSTALDEDSGENVVTIEDPENIFVGDDWDKDKGTVSNAAKVSATSINGSAMSLLETSLLEGPNLTDLQRDLGHGYMDIERAQTLLKEFSVAQKKTKSLAKDLAEAIEVRNSLSQELQQYAAETADISKNMQTDVLSNSNSSRNSSKVEAEIKLDVGKGEKTLSWHMLDNKTASGVVNESVSVQEAAEKVASLATKAGQASVKCKTLEQSWHKADSHQRGLAKRIEARLRRAVLSSSLSLDNLGKSGAQVDLAAISSSLGKYPPSAQAIVGLRDRKEEEEQPIEVERQLLKEEGSGKEKTRVNWWTISLTGIIILLTLMMVAMLWWPFAT